MGTGVFPGLERPGRANSGWLNRALALLEPDTHINPRGGNIFAVGPTTPLVVRGAAPVMLWTPAQLVPAPVDTVTRVLDLYRHTDLALARVLEERIGLAAIAQENGMEPKLPGGNQQRRPIQQLARFLFCRSCRDHSQISRQPRGATDWRACLQRLGHAHQRALPKARSLFCSRPSMAPMGR